MHIPFDIMGQYALPYVPMHEEIQAFTQDAFLYFVDKLYASIPNITKVSYEVRVLKHTPTVEFLIEIRAKGEHNDEDYSV